MSLIPSLFTGNILKAKETNYTTCKKLNIETPDSVFIETDGENIGYPPAEYSILEKALRVII